jgi:hypothetical protein
MATPRRIPITRINKLYQLYGLYCPENDVLRYIGITTGLLSTRLINHLRKPTNGKIVLWFNELKKNNKKPIIKLIREYNTYDELLLGEINEIKINREINNNLLNIADGGDINPMFGKTHTDESKLKISKNNKGLKRTEEQLKNKKILLGQLWNNDEWSEIVKNKMRKNLIGNNRALGFKHSEETKKKMSDLHKNNNYCLGFKHSEETKKKMSDNNSGENNPMFGKTLPKEVLIKRSQKVKNDGTFKGENNPNFKYKISKDELYNFYIKENKKISEIANHYGCHRTVISDNLKKYNIKKIQNKYNIELNDINKYLLDGMSQVEISKIYNCSSKYINNIIKNKIKNL